MQLQQVEIPKMEEVFSCKQYLKVGGGGVFGRSSETRLKTIWKKLMETKDRLKMVKGSFCNIWHVCCVPMSRLTMVSERRF